MAEPSPFLTAQWRYLLMANYEVDPAALVPRVPLGTELDLWQGKALVSVVGFRFLDTRLRGVPVPLHRDFDEVNLRFYLRRRERAGWQRGVAFVKEWVPRAALAWVARRAYGEPYVALPMRHRVQMEHASTGRPGQLHYAWRRRGRWESLEATTRGLPVHPAADSEESFITEHDWGWTRRDARTTSAYEVRHPPWRVWQVASFHLDADARSLYGAAFAEALRAPPRSVFVAEGSPVSVLPSRLLTGDAAASAEAA